MRVHLGIVVAGLVLTGAAMQAVAADAAVPSGVYRADQPFPEFMPLWREGWNWKDENGEKFIYARPGMPLGGYLFAYFRNTGSQPVEVTDALLQGVSLSGAVAPEREVKVKGGEDKYPSALQFSKLSAEQIGEVIAAGEPVWWKVEPKMVPPGGMAELTVRLRRDPKVSTVTVGIPALNGAKAEVEVERRQPRFFSINFSPKLDEVHAYLRHPSGRGIKPARVLVDGQDVTAKCTIAADMLVDTVPVIIRLGRPLEKGSYHFFQAEYSDGSQALAGIGAWYHGMLYGVWGAGNKGNSPEEVAKNFITDWAEHNVNLHMGHSSGPGNDFFHSDAGFKFGESIGIRRMANWINTEHEPAYYFLTDEPDAADYGSKMLPADKRLGSLAQWLVDRCELFRRKDPAHTPLLLNVDNTFKPENWYMYAQLADVPCADPYYQEGVQSVWKSDPTNLGPYLKPTYVYAVGTIYQSACAPDPMHLILHTCRFDFPLEECPYRGPTPEEKRIEVYYGIAAGAKAFSYWWYTPFDRYHGCGADDPESVALWTEIGLVGAELRTAESVITRSCPATVAAKGSRYLWLRTLLADDDTLALIVVNDNMASDRLGTVVCPVENARVALQLPGWLKAADVFEVSADGMKTVAWQAADGQLAMDLGTVDLTRFIMITQDKQLQSRLQTTYSKNFASNVRKLKLKSKVKAK